MFKKQTIWYGRASLIGSLFSFQGPYVYCIKQINAIKSLMVFCIDLSLGIFSMSIFHRMRVLDVTQEVSLRPLFLHISVCLEVQGSFYQCQKLQNKISSYFPRIPRIFQMFQHFRDFLALSRFFCFFLELLNFMTFLILQIFQDFLEFPGF